MTKFRNVNRDGKQWLVAVCNGVWHWLHSMGNVGDRIRPGQQDPHRR